MKINDFSLKGIVSLSKIGVQEVTSLFPFLYSTFSFLDYFYFCCVFFPQKAKSAQRTRGSISRVAWGFHV
jgi:hypothetical protein